MVKNTTEDFANHAIKSSFYYGMSAFFVKLLVPFNVILVVSSLNPYQYGVYKLTFSLFVVVNGLLLSGLNGLVLNDASRYFGSDRKEEAWRLIFEFFITRLAFGFFACAAFYFGAQILGDHYSPGIAAYLRILSALFITDAIITVSDTILKAKLDFLASSFVGLIPEILKAAFLVYFSFFAIDGLNIERLFWTIFFSNVISMIVIVAYLGSKFGLKASIPSSNRYIMLKLFKNQGKWAMAKNYISSFVDSARLWIVRIFVSTEAVGIYSVAASIVTTIRKIVPTQSISSLIPRYISDEDLLKKIYLRFTKYSIWLFSSIFIFSFFVVPPIVMIFLPQYAVSIPYFKILVFSIFINSMILNKQILYSSHKQKFLLATSFIELTSVILCGLILVKTFGLFGAVLETILTELLMTAVIYLYLMRIHPTLRFSPRSIFVFNTEDVFWIKYLRDSFIKRINKAK